MSDDLIVIDESTPPWIKVVIDENASTPFCVTINEEVSNLPDMHDVVAASCVKGFYISNLITNFIKSNETEYDLLIKQVVENRYSSLKIIFMLGAALQILEWESNGFVRMEMELPRASTILDALQRDFIDCSQAGLLDLVARCYVENFLLSPINEFGADTLIEISDEQELAMKLAKFMWSLLESKPYVSQ